LSQLTTSFLTDAWNTLERIYSSAESPEILLYATVQSGPYENWRQASKSLFRQVGVCTAFWSELAREATKLSMILHNSPIAPSDIYCQGILGANLQKKSYQQGLDNEASRLLDQFWMSLKVLRKIAVSPYIQWLLDTHDPECECSLIVYKSDWLRASNRAIRSKAPLRHFTVLSASSLIEPRRLTKAYVCGALSIYPQSIYTSGRADQVLWSIFDWMKPYTPDMNPSLYEDVQFEPTIRLISTNPGIETQESEKSVDISGLWELPISPLQEDQNAEVDDLELVDSVPLLLATGARTFVPIYDRVQVAFPQDSTRPNSITLSKKFGADISVDDFVILRSYGEKDIIVLLADELLGNRSQPLRSSQQRWKAALRSRVAATSISLALRSLRDLGSTIANEQNLRNWMSPRNIRTQEKTEFLILLEFCGLKEDAERIWDEMGEIVRAHTRSGRLLKLQLSSELTAHTGADLLSQHRIDVSIQGVSSGSLIAIRVEALGAPRPISESSLLRIVEPWQC
jgi:hypothetical protein